MIGNGGEYAALDLADCRHHRVDWRARALAAEAALDEIARLVSPSADQSVVDAVRDLCEHIDDLRANAAWRAKVAPLIERLRGEVGSRDVYRSPYDLIDAVYFLLSATEPTP